MTRFRLPCALALLGLGLAACSQSGPEGGAPAITVEGGWVRATPGGNDVTAGYFTLINTGGADTLLGASSDELGNVEMHSSGLDDRGVMRMEPLDSIEIPAGGQAVFAPGGNHLMLYGASGLALGDTVCLMLDFERSEDRIACLPVLDSAPE